MSVVSRMGARSNHCTVRPNRNVFFGVVANSMSQHVSDNFVQKGCRAFVSQHFSDVEKCTAAAAKFLFFNKSTVCMWPCRAATGPADHEPKTKIVYTIPVGFHTRQRYTDAKNSLCSVRLYQAMVYTYQYQAQQYGADKKETNTVRTICTSSSRLNSRSFSG